MVRYDTDLWSFLKGNDEKSLGISQRLKLANKFVEKFNEIQSKKVKHRDYKPNNVLLNLTPDKKWNGEIEITDFGIAAVGGVLGEQAGSSGWSTVYQYTTTLYDDDDFAARLLVFMILLSWNTAWLFIWDPWDGKPTVTQSFPIEMVFAVCKSWDEIPIMLSFIGKWVGDERFCDEWALYCRSLTANLSVNSNTQCSVNVEMISSEINLDKEMIVTDGTRLHGQASSHLCHSFAIVTSLRKELENVMEGKKSTHGQLAEKLPLEVLEFKTFTSYCSFKDLLLEFVAQISPRSMNGLAGQDSNQKELSAQFCDMEKAIKRLVYPTRAFEEGWKRMGGLRSFFYYFGFEESYHNAFELSYCQVGHPNSGKNSQFYPTAVSLGILASPLPNPPTTFDSALDHNHNVIARNFIF